MKYKNDKILTIIIEEIKKDPKITEVKLAKITSYTERTIRRYIKILKETSVIKRVGFGKNGKWQIID